MPAGNNVNSVSIGVKTVSVGNRTLANSGSIPQSSATGIGYPFVDVGKITFPEPGQITKLVLGVQNTGIGSTTIINNKHTGTGTAWNGDVHTEKFNGLVPGAKITEVHLNVNTAAGNVRVKVYKDDGAGGGPGTLLAESGSIAVGGMGVQSFALTTPATVPASGNVWAGFETDSALLSLWGQPASGNDRYHVAHVYGAGPNPFGTFTASTFPLYMEIVQVVNGVQVRAKVYQDNGVGGGPSTLLGESNAINVNTTGLNAFPLISPANIPTSKNVWAGFETNSSSLSINTTGSSTFDYTNHTFGAGPSPFGTISQFASSFWGELVYNAHTHVRVKVYQDDGGAGNPGTLLSESASVPVNGTGVQTFNLPSHAVIPASGNVWAGFETDASSLNVYQQTGLANGTRIYVAHTYGTGPNPFGSGTGTTNAPWESIGYNAIQPTVTIRFDSSIIDSTISDLTGRFSKFITIPSTTFGTHIINATDTGGKTAIATFTVPYATSTFNISGYVVGPNGFFPYPTLGVISSSYLNMTKLQLYNATTLLQTKTFSPPIHIFANTTMTIPWNFTDNSLRTGTQTYTEQATLQQNSFNEVISSNMVTLTYGTTSIGNLSFNQTNPTSVPIWFIRGDHGSNTRLSVIFPNSANLTCNLNYQTAQTNHTYFNIPKVTYDPNQKNSSFLFVNSTNDFVKVNCTDLNNHANQGLYVLSITNFPFVQQIKNFRSGMYGTTGQFGMLDIITLSVVIFSMIGFNRINEGVGAFFSLAIIGATAYFGILTFPGIVLGAVAVVTVLGVTSVRKIGGF